MERSRRLPPLNALRVLEAIQMTGSVTAAARALKVSHSAVSHQMKILDAWSDTALFVRRGRGTALTAPGHALAVVAHEAFDAIRHEMDRLPLRALRSVSIAALPIVATEWLVPRLADFADIHPDTTLHLSLAQTDRPANPAPDIEILFARHAMLRPGDSVFLKGSAVPVCAPGLLARHGTAAGVLAQAPRLLDEDLRMWAAWEAAGGVGGTDSRAPQLVIEGSALLRAAAIAGRGAAICRTAFLADDVAAGRLAVLSEIGIDDDWCYFLRCPPARRHDPEVARVIAWLERQAA